MWGEKKALELLAEAGFTDVAVKQVEGDFLNNFYIARKPLASRTHNQVTTLNRHCGATIPLPLICFPF